MASSFSTLLLANHISDLSIPDTGNGNDRHTIGLTSHLLESDRSAHGKILNALDFPMTTPSRALLPPESIATHLKAWQDTVDEPHCKRGEKYPDHDVQWALAATSHAHHYFHIDADGFATYIAPQSGAKYWVAAREKPGSAVTFSTTDLYVGSKYAIDKANTHVWDLEGVLLKSGTCL